MADSPFSCMLWDVDGTIADASPGILRRLGTVFTEYGVPQPDPSTLSAWIGPPLFESFQRLAGLSPERAQEALLRYRELAGADGYAESVTLYPGVPEVIRAVRDAGIPQATASSKPENQVRAIIEHYGLADNFVTTAGARSGVIGQSDTKAMVIADALQRLRDAGIDTSAPVLIGDREHDVEGAAEFGIPVIFVAWGFGTDAEAAGAAYRVSTASALQTLLLGEASA